MVIAISQISEIKTIVERSRVLPLNQAQLQRQAIARMAHTSTSIEGNKLAQFEVDKVLSGMSVNADAKSILEVKNYQQALKKVEEIAELPGPITSKQILELHRILMLGLLPKEKTGAYRPGDIYIVDDLGNGKEVLRFKGPDAKKVPYLINELLLWLNSKQKIPPILKAAIFHLQFVTIHPFSDGNGRITRLLTNLILYKENWDFRKIIVLEDYYNRDRLAYYNALNEVQGDKFHSGEDLTSWIDYFILGFLLEAKEVAKTISSIGQDQIVSDEEQILLDRDEIKIIDLLASSNKTTSSDIEKLLHIAKRTAQLKLKNLVDKKLIEVKGRGPSTFYTQKQ